MFKPVIAIAALAASANAIDVSHGANIFNRELISYIQGDTFANPCVEILEKWIEPDTEIHLFDEIFTGHADIGHLCLKLKRLIALTAQPESELMFVDQAEGFVGIKSLVNGYFYHTGNMITNAEIISTFEFNLATEKLDKLVLMFPQPMQWLTPWATKAVGYGFELWGKIFKDGFGQETLNLVADNAVLTHPNFFFSFGQTQFSPIREYKGKQGFVQYYTHMFKFFDMKEMQKYDKIHNIVFADDSKMVVEFTMTFVSKFTGKVFSRSGLCTQKYNTMGQLVSSETVLNKPIAVWDILPPAIVTDREFEIDMGLNMLNSMGMGGTGALKEIVQNKPIQPLSSMIAEFFQEFDAPSQWTQQRIQQRTQQQQYPAKNLQNMKEQVYQKVYQNVQQNQANPAFLKEKVNFLKEQKVNALKEQKLGNLKDKYQFIFDEAENPLRMETVSRYGLKP